MSSFVSSNKLLEAVGAIKMLLNKSKDNTDKKSLFEDDDKILLQVDFKKIPANKTTFIHQISLPHHWRQEVDTEVCLIVKDINKEALADRDLDLDTTKSHFRQVLQEKEVNEVINEIVTLRELQTEFNVFEAKDKLCNAFDVFLVDKKLMNNKYKILPRFLGKKFWLVDKKVPIPIDFASSDLKNEIEIKLNQTCLYVSGKGNTSSVVVGSVIQANRHIADNLSTVLDKIKQEFGSNVRSLRLKTSNSMAIMFYLDCGFIKEVEMRPKVGRPQPVVDEFSHFEDKQVAVYPNGYVRVLGSSGKEKRKGKHQTNKSVKAKRKK